MHRGESEMLNKLCDLVSRIVFSGVNGTILIIPLTILLYITFGQVQEFVSMAKEIWREGEN